VDPAATAEPPAVSAVGGVRSRGVALAIGGVAFAVALVFPTWDLASVGITWDEAAYNSSARLILRWLAGVAGGEVPLFDRAAIEFHFDWAHTWNHHPPFFKLVMAAALALFGDALGADAAIRVAPRVWLALAAGGAGAAAARAWGAPAGLFAAGALLTMPRVVAHGFVAGTDTPITALWVGASIGFVRLAQGAGLRWGVLAAGCLGMALATKVTAALLPATLGLWVVLGERDAWLGRIRQLAAIGVAGLLIATALNPLAWQAPVDYWLQIVDEGVGRSRTHPFGIWYFGTQYFYSAPWHYPFVMTLVTLPIPLSLATGLGFFQALRRASADGWARLCAIQVAVFLCLTALPTSPNHDGVRLFLPMFPFLASLAGLGLQRLCDAAAVRVPASWRGATAAVIGLAFLLPGTVSTLQTAPFYLSYYNTLIGGLAGAERRGMEVTYWYDAATPDFLEQLNGRLEPGDVLATFPTTFHFQYLQRIGRLRPDIGLQLELTGADWYLLYRRQSVFRALEREIDTQDEAEWSYGHDGVALIKFFEVEHPPE